MKEFIKSIIKHIPIAFTQNQKYDRDTLSVIQKVCKIESNCIDIGCHKGEILDLFLAAAPKGKHLGFEPIPDLYAALQAKYANIATIYPYALSEEAGFTTFNYVISNPAYSGIKKRNYDKAGEKDQEIKVEMRPLDSLIPADMWVDFVKIDVEGGELQVLKGSRKMLSRCKPIVIFEHGLGASDCYGTEPKDIFAVFEECEMSISTMQNWLRNSPAFSLSEFEKQFYDRTNYYFIAYPKK